MKRLKLANFILVVFVLIAEILPYGAELKFDVLGDGYLKYYSYFDATTYGYGNFGPLITASLSCLLAFVVVLSLFSEKKALSFLNTTVSAITFLVSLMPIFVDCITTLGMAISLMLFVCLVLSILIFSKICKAK